MSIDEYARYLSVLIADGNWDEIEKEIYAVNMPDGWQEMVKGFYADLAGKELTFEILSFEDLPEHVLHWLKMAPVDVLKATRKAVRLKYDESTYDGEDSGSLELAMFERDDGPSILMVGG